MSISRVIVALLLLFLAETSVMPLILPMPDRVIPHFVFVLILFSGMHRSRHSALLLGVGFGMLQDIVQYGHLMGPASFFMGLMGYLSGVMLEKKQVSAFTAVSVVLFACLLYDAGVFAIYKGFRITDASFEWAFFHHMVPSLLLQLLFAIISYRLAKRLLERQHKPSGEIDEE